MRCCPHFATRLCLKFARSKATRARADGQLFTWGDGAHGRLGHGSMEPSPEPTLVAALQHRRVVTAACGYYHTAAVCADALLTEAALDSQFDGEGAAAGGRRYLYTWGAAFEAPHAKGGLLYSSNEGCLGLPGLQPHEGTLKPHAVELGDVQAVACGMNFTVALDRDGTVFQMGSMLRGGPVDGGEWEAAALPTRVRGALDGLVVKDVRAGRSHACAAAAKDGGAWSPRAGAALANRLITWGSNAHGQLGRAPLPPPGWAQNEHAAALPGAARLAWVTPEVAADRQGAPVRHCAASAATPSAAVLRSDRAGGRTGSAATVATTSRTAWRTA